MHFLRGLPTALGVIGKMHSKDLHGVAQNLAAMAVSSRLSEDLEMLSVLPDGVVRVNLIAGTAMRPDGTAMSLQIGPALWAWIAQQSSERGFALTEIEKAEIQLQTDTSRIPTNRASIVSFDLRAISTLVRGGREYTGEASNHMWHERTPNKSIHATCEDARA
jgi:hypothetical protein